LAEWQTWYLKMHEDTFRPVLLDSSWSDEKKREEEKRQETEILKTGKESLRMKCDNGYADCCWEQAATNTYGSKANLLQALYDLSKGEN